ncbi:hypothetical protein SVIO_010770 [Streptomyces violaceusniger]|uniref:Uncharacterized protein n=1 Tax=Streptomyces violaceusniger TaxID=68280 RepID=A0A4D4KQJ3_STRVO|nr:hypothetical protein SVIO_010770 [Streptomyces violaceusniger]
MARTLPGADRRCRTPPGHSVRLRCRQTESAPGEAARARHAAAVSFPHPDRIPGTPQSTHFDAQKPQKPQPKPKDKAKDKETRRW